MGWMWRVVLPDAGAAGAGCGGMRGSDPIGGVRVVELIDSAMKGEVRIVP